MDQHQEGMNGDGHGESSSNADEFRPSEQNPGTDSRDVDMKPASPGSQHLSSAPTTPEALKKPSKRGNFRVKLNLFHKRRKASSLDAPMNREGGVLFGRSLAKICRRPPNSALPRPLMELLRIVYVIGPTTEGVFRRCANKSTCRSIRRQLDAGIDCGPIDVHIASSLLTELLRKLPDCLLRCRLYDQWLESSSKSDDEDRISSLRQLVRGLPACNLLLLRHLICVLHRIDVHSDQTKMTSGNLGVCLGPSLLWSKTTTLDNQRRDVDRVVTTVKALIDHASLIFGLDCLELFRDSESFSNMTDSAADQQAAADAGVEESTVCLDSLQCVVTGSNDPSIASLSQKTNALSSTPAFDLPAPVAPPRRKRSSVVLPPIFVCVAEDHSATPITAGQFLDDDKTHLSRWLSSDSEFSSKECQSRNNGMETTDGETVEDSDDTSVTEDDLDGRRSSMLSVDLADEEDSLMAIPTVNDNVEEQHRRSGATSTVAERNRSKVTARVTKTGNDLSTTDESNWPNLRRAPRGQTPVDRPASSIGLMSFSSTEEMIAGERRLFFGSSFSSTAGSDADLSTFGESLDSGTAFSESFELPGGAIRRRKQMEMEMDRGSNSSAAAIPTKDYHDQEVSGKQKYLAPKHQRGIPFNANCDRQLTGKAPAGTGENGAHAISDSSTDVCHSEISSVTKDPGLVTYHRTGQETGTSGQSNSLKSTQTLNTPGQSAQFSRRHSIGSRDPESVGNLCGSQTRERKGMTNKGSDIFPGTLAKTFGSRAPKGYNKSGWECKSKSGTKSENEEGSGIYYPGRRLTSDERIIVSDIEFSESTTDIPSGLHHRSAKGCQNFGSPEDALVPYASQGERQSDGDVGEPNLTRTALMGLSEEDEEKGSNARRLRLDPKDCGDDVEQLKNQQQQQAALVTLPKNEKKPSLQEKHKKEGEERTIVGKEDTEEKKQSAVNCSARQGKPESVGIEGSDASGHAQLAARSCGDLSKLAELKVTDGTNKLQRPEHESRLKHVSSLGALSSGDSRRRRFCVPRSRRGSTRDRSTSSSSCNSDDERRMDDNNGKKRTRRKRYRRSRKARNSDTRLQTDRENRVNLVRSKSDSNTLIRELIMRREDVDVEFEREAFRKEISRRKAADQRTLSSKDVFQDRQLGTEHLSNGTIRAKNLEVDDRTISELPLETREGNRKSVALKDRDWHKDLVREVESTQKSHSSRHANLGTPVSGTESKWQRKTKDSYGSSDDKFKNSKGIGSASSTIPGISKCVSRTPNGKLLDHSSSDSTKCSTDDAMHPSERLRGHSPDVGGKLNDEASVSYDGSGGDGSGSSTTSLRELRANLLKKFESDFQKDVSRSKEISAQKCTPTNDKSNIVCTSGSFLGVQKLSQRRNTVCSDVERGNMRDHFREKTDTHSLPAAITAQSVIKITEDANHLPKNASSDDSKSSSTSEFVRISVKDIVAMKNSSSGLANGKNDSPKPPVPLSNRRGEGRTAEAWRPEVGRSVARRASHATLQVKPEVEISLTPELVRKMPPKTEQKPKVSLVASMSIKNPPSVTNRLPPPPVCARSHSVKSSCAREAEIEQKRVAETAASMPSQTAAAGALTSDASQRQKQSVVSKSSNQATLASVLSAESSHVFPRSSGVSSTDRGKVLHKTDADVCANEKVEEMRDCGEPTSVQTIPRSQESDPATDKTIKPDMPWSVANLRNKYGNQNPQ